MASVALFRSFGC
ncbi:uncharacterized protein FRV6_09448 [Fusarium oxysporum]|uniref:Uncharacterized protein n=1 Tax=Fusarium oxysporum TaxID=5507 RepID=A0A2H3THV8_FUSOX|nr:uncharacterized protein FRV6_09448 [Fusarium oxysporum]